MELTQKFVILSFIFFFYQISKSFKTNSATNLTKLFKIYDRPKLEYYTKIWLPY